MDTAGVFALPAEARAEVVAREQRAGLALMKAGTLKSIWRVPGKHRNVGIWSARDADELHTVLSSLPIFPYASFDVTALATHPLITGDYAFARAGASSAH
ncbi:muconolactone delta-isomerase [Amycolatopsis panacis]|uniref:Muconolactone delta-isomerase n=1 Tax=Amycolatopsis panacis TaxID=2340917 RepID=A0A419I2C2_9PSEU|nr:muconolactone delta-isomerase [Amycolatopsis panacis]